MEEESYDRKPVNWQVKTKALFMFKNAIKRIKRERQRRQLVLTKIELEKARQKKEERFRKIYWIVFKSIILSYSGFLIWLKLMALLWAYMWGVTGKTITSFVSFEGYIERRNISALVPIWFLEDTFMNGDKWMIPYCQMFSIDGILSVITGITGLITLGLMEKHASEKSIIVSLVSFCFLIICTGITHLIGHELSFELESPLHEAVKENFIGSLKSHYRINSNHTMASAVNIAMTINKCCGVNGPFDFESIDLSASVMFTLEDGVEENKPPRLFLPEYSHEDHIFNIPPGCCKDHIFQEGTPQQQYKKAVMCGKESYNSIQINTGGCYKPFIATFEKLAKLVSFLAEILHILQTSSLFLCLNRALQYFDGRKLLDRQVLEQIKYLKLKK